MNDTIAIHGFETSNNRKVRIALGYKELPYTFHPIDPADRGPIVALSGQHLTPVMVHGDRVLFDSAAILRYLDANFPDRPRLFGSSRDEQWEIEDWERFGRSDLAAPMMAKIHAKAAGKPVDPSRDAELREQFVAALARIESRLIDREWLVGDRMSAADITAAAVIHRIASAGVFALPDQTNASATAAAWQNRVMAYDAHLPR